MFDDVHFTGTINLGAIVVALLQLVSVLTIYFRVKAIIIEKEWKVKFPIRRKIKPASQIVENTQDSTKVPDESISEK